LKSKLFRRDFSLVVAGQIVSVLGSAVLRFSMSLYILDVTGRADLFGLLIAVSSIPAIIFTPVGGAIADRFSRRNLMVIFDIGNGLIVGVLIFLLTMGSVHIIAVGVILTALALIGSMYQPTVQASVPVLVSEELLANGNGIVTAVGALSGLLGPVLGGVLFGIIGLDILVIGSCVLFFLSAFVLLFVRIPFTKRALEKGIVPTILADMKLGFRYVVKEKPAIRTVTILAAALNMLMVPLFIVGLPYILRVVLESSEGMFGIGMGILELSTILGAVSVGVITKNMTLPKLHRLLFVSALLILPIALAVSPLFLELGYWPSFTMLMGFTAGVVVLATVISIFIITLVQKATPNEMLGKVMAIIMAVSQCATPLGMALYGLVFELFSRAVFVPVLIACAFTLGITFVAKQMLRTAEI